MPITESHGYNKTIRGTDWGVLSHFLGGHPAALTPGAWRVRAGTGALQSVVADGLIYGGGIIDLMVGEQIMSHSSVASGSRWDTIYARRDYAANATTLGIQQGSALEVPVLPAAVDKVRFDKVGMVRIDGGKVGAVKQLLMQQSPAVYGPSAGLTDVYDGLVHVDETLTARIRVSGDWQPLAKAPTQWSGTTDVVSENFTLVSSAALVPTWYATTAYDTNSLAVTLSARAIALKAGWYTIQPFIHTSDNGGVIWSVLRDCTSLPSSVVGVTDSMGGKLMGLVANGGSRTIRLGADAKLTLTLRTTSGAAVTVYRGISEYLNIVRLGNI